jgi:hypothetical protein
MRIKQINAYLWNMKTRLNLTIDTALLAAIKAYANQKQTSVSELVEHYFKNVAKPAKRKNIIQLVEKLGTPSIAVKGDLKKQFYEDQATKYGF